MSKPKSLSLNLKFGHFFSIIFINKPDLVTFVDVKAGALKDRPEVLAGRRVGNVADEDLGWLPRKQYCHSLRKNVIHGASHVCGERYGKTYELESSTLSLFPLYARPPSFLTACWALWS